jgi:Protein of unknown function (DUF1761)
MEFMGVNLLGILLAALSTMVVGFIWYSPMLFARPWTIAMGYDPDDKAKMDEMRKGAGPLYGIALVASLVSAFILGKVILGITVDSALYGMKVGFGVWLGFVATVQLTDTLFGKRPLKLFLINTGYQLVCYLAMGAIIGAWQK